MTSSSTEKRPYAARMSPHARREQLLDAALEIINSRGVAAVSVDAVAKACQVTRPVVYGQFTDANHILRVLLDREAERALGQLVAAAPDPVEGSDPVRWFTDRTRAVIDAILERPDTWRAILLPVGAVPGPVRKYQQRGQLAMVERFVTIIEHFLRDRENADEVDVELVALTIVKLTEELGRLVLDSPNDYPPERLVRFAAASIEALFTRHPRSPRA